MPTTPCVQVQTAAGSRAEAGRIAEALLSRRLAACVQIVGPVESRYRWQGQLESAEEWLCLAKTTSACVDAAMEAIGLVHSYETPEIIVTAIMDGNTAYLRWITAQVGADE